MECPYCAETIKNEAIVCKHCGRDLRVVRPVLLEIEALVADVDDLRNQLDEVNTTLDRRQRPIRHLLRIGSVYVLAPAALLVAVHILVTIVFDLRPLALRLASVIMPLLAGFAAYRLSRIRLRGAVLLGSTIAALGIGAMLTVTAIHDDVPVFPTGLYEWREVAEYGASILLATICGNILAHFIFRVIPRALERRGKPTALAFSIARSFGSHVGDEQLRRRARLIQEFIQAFGPLLGVTVTACGSLYAGLKSVLN